MFGIAAAGNETEARTQIRLSLQARQAALSTAVSRLLVQNNEEEQRAAVRTQQIYDRVERNVYGFLAAMIIVIIVTGLYYRAIQPTHVPASGCSFGTTQ